MAAAVEHTYEYPFASEVVAEAGGKRLRLATSGARREHPHFFHGLLRQPRRLSDLLLALSLISRTRFFLAPGMLSRILAAADPVVTSGGERLRFEAFSVCCGVYARVDVHPEAMDGDWASHGTTNVDFNPPMRAALGRIGATDRVGLTVGTDRVEISRGEETVVERKVKLPMRWLKGFIEVQAYQSRLRLSLDLSADEMSRFLRSLPTQVAPGMAFAVAAGKGLRVSQRETAGAVPLGGAARLRALSNILRHGRRVRVFTGDDGVSAWEVVTDDARFHLVLSPDAARGFSGEGQALDTLARSDAHDAVGRVRAALRWQARLTPDALAAEADVTPAAAASSLSVLGARGLVGFDVGEAAYFHRELPFDLELVEALQPRLLDARKLVDEAGVRIVSDTAETAEAYVRGTGVEHRVRANGEDYRCTCPWFSRNQGERGPCKHILALQIVREDGAR